MRIINTVFGDATGGRWRVVLDYARVLTGLGHEVLLVLNRRTAAVVDNLPEGVAIAWVRNSGHYDLYATRQARRLIKQFRPDAIIAHCGRSVGVMKWAAHRKLPVIGVCHSNNVKRIVPADAYFNISTHIDRMIREFPNHSSLAFHLPNMIEVPESAVFPPRVLHQPPVIGALGRFDRVKGFDVYLQALAQLKQRGLKFRAFLGGGGEDEPALRRLAKASGLDHLITFPGWVSDPGAFFDEIDLLCIPSRSDAFGITPLEAAVAGVPQVLSDAEGHKDMFTNGEHALLVSREQPELLANALQQMIEDYNLAQLLAKKAFDRVVTCYSEKEFARKLEQNLAEVANRFPVTLLQSDSSHLSEKSPAVACDIYVINLHEASARRDRIQRDLTTLGLDDVNIVEAVNGCDIPSSLKESLYADHKSIMQYGRSLTAGELGCALSHLKCYKTFLKSPNRFALVLEDDAVMAPSFKDILTCSEMERWLDVPNPRLLLLTPLRSFLKRGQQSFFNEYKLVKVRRTWGGHGYLVNRAAAEIMVRINSPCWLSADDWVTYRKLGMIDVRGVEPFCVGNLEEAGSHLEKDRRIVETQVPKKRVWARRSQKWFRQFMDLVYYRPFWGLKRQKTDKDWY